MWLTTFMYCASMVLSLLLGAQTRIRNIADVSVQKMMGSFVFFCRKVHACMYVWRGRVAAWLTRRLHYDGFCYAVLGFKYILWWWLRLPFLTLYGWIVGCSLACCCPIRLPGQLLSEAAQHIQLLGVDNHILGRTRTVLLCAAFQVMLADLMLCHKLTWRA